MDTVTTTNSSFIGDDGKHYKAVATITLESADADPKSRGNPSMAPTMNTVTTTTSSFVGTDGKHYKAATTITPDPTAAAPKVNDTRTTTKDAILHCADILCKREGSDHDSIITGLQVMTALRKIWRSVDDLDSDFCHTLVDTALDAPPRRRPPQAQELHDARADYVLQPA
jgi:hypothetical protein